MQDLALSRAEISASRLALATLAGLLLPLAGGADCGGEAISAAQRREVAGDAAGMLVSLRRWDQVAALLARCMSAAEPVGSAAGHQSIQGVGP